jgi:hypothetical protein
VKRFIDQTSSERDCQRRRQLTLETLTAVRRGCKIRLTSPAT